MVRATWQGNKEVLWPINVKELNTATWNEESLLLTSHQTTELCEELNPTNNHVTDFGIKSSPTWDFRWDQKWQAGASLVAQWLRVCLLMQGTRVRALVWEDSTCRGATRPVSHNYWACAPGACAPQQERPR